MHKEIASFLHYIEYEKRFSKHTISSYQMDLFAAVEFFKTQHITTWQDVQESTIRALLSSRRSQALSSRTLNRQLSTLRTFYRFLMRNHLIQDNKALTVLSLKSSRT